MLRSAFVSSSALIIFLTASGAFAPPCAQSAEHPDTSAGPLEIRQVPPRVELKGKLGGRLDGTPWSSDELKGKVHVIFYVDPDKKDLNNEASEALKAAELPRDKFQSFGIINMAATWLPNFVISSELKKKQKRYPTQ